ncbi:acetoin utilization protein AcuC [Marivita sp. XM-24bin2]|jgi:acetoin utilization protein AcuC|uniref:acetoin utilization protein AcuC n=1 Tax=unclassified Marivita TaxID=2632480 RepID=UPI000D78F5C7|nr:acetoin utilization protein AcuC [Marivita sp. XM-24bin2]MCR9107877.1 acetoin utilization protein AcuC [Paracoccaceae bacterium]PWL34614.1 MAG: acetoin utilization protein AcuC [Marivita sp. XM-24bin2]
MTNPIFIGARIYRGSSYGPRHPLSIPRVPTVTDLCRNLGWLSDTHYRNSPCAKPSALTGFHTKAYIDALQRAETTQTPDPAYDLGTLSNPVFPEVYRRPATAAGGGLLAAEHVRSGGVAYNPGGGTHHGLPDRANGFCYINEPVLTIRHLLGMGLSRIAYVDIDAHHCDGVAVGFHGSEQVQMISVHEDRRWPFTGTLDDNAGGAAINIPVPRGFNDTEFDLILNEIILPAVSAQKPDAIYLQCGADAVTEDPLSRLTLSNRCHVQAITALRPLAPRLIVSGGGGYNPWSVGRAWSCVWATLAGYEIPEDLPHEAASVLHALRWSRKAAPTETLLTTLLDAPRPGPISAEVRAAVEMLSHRVRT